MIERSNELSPHASSGSRPLREELPRAILVSCGHTLMLEIPLQSRPLVSDRSTIDTCRDLGSKKWLVKPLRGIDEYRARGCFLAFSSERNVYNKITARNGAMSLVFGFLSDATRPSVSHRSSIDTRRDVRSEGSPYRLRIVKRLQGIDEYRARGCFLAFSSERNVYNKTAWRDVVFDIFRRRDATRCDATRRVATLRDSRGG